MKLTPKHKISLLSLLAFSVMLLLNSCGGGGAGGDSSSSGGSTGGGGKSGVAGINGRIVFSDSQEPNTASIISLDLVNGKAQNLDILGTGYGSHIGTNGNIIFVQNCNPSYNEQLVIVDTNGLVTPTSSCSNLIDNPPDATLGHYDYISPKFSPDQKKIAVSLITDNNFVKTVYPMVAVFERDKVDINTDLTKQPSTKIFHGYNAFAWKPDGSLLLIGSGQRLILKEGPYGEVLEELPTIKHGIYVTDKNLNNPHRIENKINSPIFRPNVSKKGTKVTYITGNHDEMLRKFTDTEIGNIAVVNKLVLELDDIINDEDRNLFSKLVKIFLDNSAIAGVQPKVLATLQDKATLYAIVRITCSL